MQTVDNNAPTKNLWPWQWYTNQGISYREYSKLLSHKGDPKIAVTLITGRCGSTLFSDMIERLNICGVGNENFNDAPIHYWIQQPGSMLGYINVKLNEARNGVFWFQASSYRYDHLILNLHPLIPSTWHYSGIIRRDIVAQASSYALASATERWHMRNSDTGNQAENVVYQSGDILSLADKVMKWVDSIVRMEIRIHEILLRRQTPTTCLLFYEDIVSKPLSSVNAFLVANGIKPMPSDTCIETCLRKLPKNGKDELIDFVKANYQYDLSLYNQIREEGILGLAERLSSYSQ